MLTEKRMLTVEDLDSQAVLDLPDRDMLGGFALVVVNVWTGDINILSFNDLNTCVNAQNLLIAKGYKLVQKCHQTNK
jgi:hypothetical protein